MEGVRGEAGDLARAIQRQVLRRASHLVEESCIMAARAMPEHFREESTLKPTLS